ncbi:tripartite motif-containing protein 2-like [Ptychodera flava]|uniref:tripartite motif-containing protein 2-like n=1 Tax=Ptychodera flava TaxID=63121 RepID=UPI00396A4F22
MNAVSETKYYAVTELIFDIAEARVNKEFKTRMMEAVDLAQDDIVVEIEDGPVAVHHGKMKRPRGVAVMPNNDFVVADGRNRSIEVLSRDGDFVNEVTFKALNNTCDPFDVAVGKKRAILATDQGLNRVYVCLEDGNLIRMFGSDEMHKPAGIALTNDDRVVVVDSEGACVRLYEYDGKYIKSFGSKGYKNGQFFTPQFVAVNSKNQIIVSDYRHDSLQVFDDRGSFLHCLKAEEDVWRPMGVATDNQDNIYVCDAFTYKIRKFGADFKPLGVLEAANGELSGPHGLAVTSGEHQQLVVADCGNNCIKLFNL